MLFRAFHKHHNVTRQTAWIKLRLPFRELFSIYEAQEYPLILKSKDMAWEALQQMVIACQTV